MAKRSGAASGPVPKDYPITYSNHPIAKIIAATFTYQISAAIPNLTYLGTIVPTPRTRPRVGFFMPEKMSVIDQIQKTIPDDKKHDLFTYLGGGTVAFLGFLNDNPDVLAAWGTFLGGLAVFLRLVWNMWQERNREP